jgi:hypothetical protein
VAHVARVDLQGALPCDDVIAFDISTDAGVPVPAAAGGGKAKGCWGWACAKMKACMESVTSAVTSTVNFISDKSAALLTQIWEALGVEGWVESINSALHKASASCEKAWEDFTATLSQWVAL